MAHSSTRARCRTSPAEHGTSEPARAHPEGEPSEDQHHGSYQQLQRPSNSPQPLVRPRVLIGGTGEKRTLPLVARYADACNLFDIPDGGVTVRRKLDAFRRACEAAGRDSRGIETTLSSRLDPGEAAAAFADRCASLDAQGIHHVVLVGNGPWTEAALEMVAHAIERLRPALT